MNDYETIETKYVGLLGRTRGVRQKYLVSVVKEHGMDTLHDMLYTLKKKCLDKIDLKVIAKDLEYVDTYDFEIVCKLLELRKLRENAKKLKKEARQKASKEREKIKNNELHLSNYGYRTRKPVKFRMNCINAAIKDWGIENVLKRMMTLSHYHEIIGYDIHSLFKNMNKSERLKYITLLEEDNSFGYSDSDEEDEPLSDEDDTSLVEMKQTNNSMYFSSHGSGTRGSGSRGSGTRGSGSGSRGRGIRGSRGSGSGSRRGSTESSSLEYSEDTVTLTMDEFSEMRDEMNRLRQLHLSSLKALDKFEKKLKK